MGGFFLQGLGKAWVCKKEGNKKKLKMPDGLDRIGSENLLLPTASMVGILTRQAQE